MSVTKAKFEQKGTMYSPAEILFFTTLDRHYKKLSSWLLLCCLLYANALTCSIYNPLLISQGKHFYRRKQTRERRKNSSNLNTKCLAGVEFLFHFFLLLRKLYYYIFFPTDIIVKIFILNPLQVLLFFSFTLFSRFIVFFFRLFATQGIPVLHKAHFKLVTMKVFVFIFMVE